MDTCMKHPHERATGICRRCGIAWCGDCLVYVYGPSKPPYCVSCAMFAAGVRTGGVRPALSRRDLRARRKAERAARRAGSEPAQARTQEAIDESTAPGAAPVSAPAPATSAATGRDDPAEDWTAAWWEHDPSPSLSD